VNIRTIITYYGGKQKMAPIILQRIPPHSLYAEPFCGGAAIFFNKSRSSVEILNDTNGELMNFYRIVKHRYTELYDLIFSTLHSRRQHEHACIVYSYPELFDEVRRAWAVWVLASQSFSAMLDGSWGYDVSRDTTTRKIHNNKSEFSFYFSRRLEHVQLESTDALKIITSRDSPTSFFYIDPPYYNSDLGHYKGYTKEDFIRLLEVLSALKGKFLLSSYPSDVLTDYTKANSWNTERFDQIVTVNIKSGKGKPKTEVLTSNYVARPPINLSLF